MDNYEENINKLYNIIPWKEDKLTFEARLEYYKHYFDIIIKKRKVFFKKKVVKILDAMGGTGVCSIALALHLKQKYGINSDIAIIDIREDSLIKAKKYSKLFLGKEVQTIKGRIECINKFPQKFDIILFCGNSLIHVNPFQLICIFEKLSLNISKKGIILLEETDRLYNFIFINKCNKEDFITKNTKEYIIDYKSNCGMLVKKIINEVINEYVIIDARYWDLATIAAFLWFFFYNVNIYYIKYPSDAFIIAKNSRYIKIKLNKIKICDINEC